MFKLSYSKKLYLIAQLKFWGILGLLILVFVLDYYYGISKINFTIRTFEFLLAFGLGFLFYPAFKKINHKLVGTEDRIQGEARAAKLGMDGERIVKEWLTKHLPEDTYSILSNVKLPGHKFDIDFIILGPKGIIVLEVKNYSEKVYFYEDECFKFINEKRYVLPIEEDPRQEARRHAYYLRRYFEKCGFGHVKILKAIAFIEPEAVEINGNTGIYIIAGEEKLKQYLDTITIDPQCTPEFWAKIKNKLIGK